MENSLRKGKYRWIVFKKGSHWMAAALEFNIVQVGDDPNVVYLEMQEAAKGYIEAAQRFKGFRDKALIPMLNQKSEEEYELLWKKAQSSTQESKSTLPSNVFGFGTRNLALV